MIDDPNEQLELARAQARKEMLQRYHNVFGSIEGRLVLGDILMMCHFGVPVNNDIERIEYNVGIAIARMSGIMQSIDRQLGIEEE